MNKQTVVNTSTPRQTGVEVAPKVIKKPAGESKPEQTFTKERVNELMKKRVERSHQSFFKRYGVKDLTELDNLVGKSRSYDPLKKIHDEHIAKYEALQQEHNGLNEKYLFETSNINPEKYDDVRTYFKGKNLNLDANTLASELNNHQDWLNKVSTFQQIGNVGSLGNTIDDEKALAEQFLGL